MKIAHGRTGLHIRYEQARKMYIVYDGPERISYFKKKRDAQEYMEQLMDFQFAQDLFLYGTLR